MAEFPAWKGGTFPNARANDMRFVALDTFRPSLLCVETGIVVLPILPFIQEYLGHRGQ